MKKRLTPVAAIVLVVGALALAVGVIYLTVEGRSLPSFLGTTPGYMGHRSKRGIVAAVLGGLLLLGGGALLLCKPKPKE